MKEWIAFAAGLVIGGNLGVFAMALLSMTRDCGGEYLPAGWKPNDQTVVLTDGALEEFGRRICGWENEHEEAAIRGLRLV